MSVLADAAALAALAERAHEHRRLAIDTEFMGEGRYQALLCLVQVAVPGPDGDLDDVTIEVLDPLDESLDPAPLARALADPSVEVVMHAARQDVALLRRTWQTEITGLFDTQLAAGFAGLRAQMGYEPMLSEVLGVRLGKSASFTRWDARPLSDEQVAYARDDVRHLLRLVDALQERLEAHGRLEWAREECRALEQVSDVREPDAVFARLPRVNGLDPRSRAVARELVVWREETARSADRPIASVINDAALVEVAKRKPRDQQALREVRGLNEGTLRRRGPEILEAVERGRQRPALPYGGERHPPPDPTDAPVVALCEALVRARAMEAELAYELIAARADLQSVVTAVRTGAVEPEVRTLTGWRRELVGGELLELLSGRRTLRVDERHRVLVDGRAQTARPPRPAPNAPERPLDS